MVSIHGGWARFGECVMLDKVCGRQQSALIHYMCHGVCTHAGGTWRCPYIDGAILVTMRSKMSGRCDSSRMISLSSSVMVPSAAP